MHGAKLPASDRHWNVAASFAVNVNDGDGLFVRAGDAAIVTVGAIVSAVHVRDAGVASTLPAASTARTWKVCDPCARPV